MDGINDDRGVLVRKLESIFSLHAREKTALLRVPLQIAQFGPEHDIVVEGDRPSRCCVLLKGLALRYKMTSDGKRQIFSFHIPGEIPDLQSFHLKTMDHTLATLTSCKVGFMEHEAVSALVEEFPRIGAAFWRETLIDGAIFRQWMLRIGRKDAAERIAHFFCEMFDRLEAVGLTDGMSCPLPLTQSQIGDALGLSTVHVNRTVQELRGQGLISLSKNVLQILDRKGLAALGEFDPTYLHQKPSQAA